VGAADQRADTENDGSGHDDDSDHHHDDGDDGADESHDQRFADHDADEHHARAAGCTAADAGDSVPEPDDYPVTDAVALTGTHFHHQYTGAP
jgi:hypothetical protein